MKNIVLFALKQQIPKIKNRDRNGEMLLIFQNKIQFEKIEKEIFLKIPGKREKIAFFFAFFVFFKNIMKKIFLMWKFKAFKIQLILQKGGMTKIDWRLKNWAGKLRGIGGSYKILGAGQTCSLQKTKTDKKQKSCLCFEATNKLWKQHTR